jgi:hypothetical protein
MSKAHDELAGRIFDKLGMLDQHDIEVEPAVNGDHPKDAVTEKAWSSRFVELGYAFSYTDKDKAKARKMSVDYLASELDAGNLVLSDGWADENLTATGA